MSLGFNPPPVTANLNVWAQNIVAYLRRTASRLQFKPTNAPATEDGVILWDATGGYPVVSKGDEWRQIVLADGYAIFSQDVDITAAAANTAYKIALDNISAQGITLTGSPLTEITFVEGGLYEVAFTAQISSSSGSAVNFRFWPRVNGSDIAGSTIVASLHNNGATITVSRTAIFSFAAGAVLSVMWATDSTNGYLHAHAATAYAPAAPSVTLAITRVQA
jgi:hypothetical protein